MDKFRIIKANDEDLKSLMEEFYDPTDTQSLLVEYKYNAPIRVIGVCDKEWMAKELNKVDDELHLTSNRLMMLRYAMSMSTKLLEKSLFIKEDYEELLGAATRAHGILLHHSYWLEDKKKKDQEQKQEENKAN